MYSQCTPNTDFTGILGLDAEAYEFGGETGDSLTALPHATVGDAYETFFDMRIPFDTVIEYDLTGDGNPQLFDPVYLTTIAVNEVQGLPMGFDWECASQDSDGVITEYNDVFPGGGYGCLKLFSGTAYQPATDPDGIPESGDETLEVPTVYSDVPNIVGTYPLVVALDIVAEYEVFGVAIPVEVTDDTMLNYLVLIVDEANNSDVMELVDSRSFKSLGTYPNPFNNSSNIHFGNDKNSEVLFSVYDVLGNLVFTEKINSTTGHNEYVFDRGSLDSGMYTYTLYNGEKSISKNIIIQ